MAKGEIFQRYKLLSKGDQATFDRWLKANAVVGLILVAALVAMALAGSHSDAPRNPMVADGAKPANVMTASQGGK
jgi:hypothetical protein